MDQVVQVPGPIETRADVRCWICHEGLRSLKYRCLTCPRVFHRRCAEYLEEDGYPRARRDRAAPVNGVDPASKLSWIKCQECLASKEEHTKYKNLVGEELKAVLKDCLPLWKAWIDTDWHLCYSKGSYNDYRHCGRYGEDVDNYRNSVARLMDLNILDGLVSSGDIKTLEGFVGELKWVTHNAFVFHGSESNITKELLEYEKGTFLERLNEVATSCIECQSWICKPKKSRDPKDILKLCKTAHPVLWVKMKTYQHWPAKMISVRNKKVEVIFFGHKPSRLVTTVDDCCMYSQSPPKCERIRQVSSYQDAIKEANKYLNNIRYQKPELNISAQLPSTAEKLIGNTAETIYQQAFPNASVEILVEMAQTRDDRFRQFSPSSPTSTL